MCGTELPGQHGVDLEEQLCEENGGLDGKGAVGADDDVGERRGKIRAEEDQQEETPVRFEEIGPGK